MATCAACSQEIPDGTRHCPMCGAEQAPSPLQAKRTVFGYASNPQELLDQAQTQQPPGGQQPQAPQQPPAMQQPPSGQPPQGHQQPPPSGGSGGIGPLATAPTIVSPPGSGPQLGDEPPPGQPAAPPAAQQSYPATMSPGQVPPAAQASPAAAPSPAGAQPPQAAAPSAAPASPAAEPAGPAAEPAPQQAKQPAKPEKAKDKSKDKTKGKAKAAAKAKPKKKSKAAVVLSILAMLFGGGALGVGIYAAVETHPNYEYARKRYRLRRVLSKLRKSRRSRRGRRSALLTLILYKAYESTLKGQLIFGIWLPAAIALILALIALIKRRSVLTFIGLGLPVAAIVLSIFIQPSHW